MGKKKVKFLRVVLDTNVIISALLFKGEANKILSSWQAGKIKLPVSKEVIEEYVKTLSYPKFNLTKQEIKYLLEEEIFPFTEPVEVNSQFNIIKEDSADNKFLSLAVDSKAEYLISGDKHLLNLIKIHKTKIISIAEFLSRESIFGGKD